MMTSYKYRNPVLLRNGRQIQAQVKFLDKGHELNDGKWYDYVCQAEDDPDTISMDLFKRAMANPKLERQPPLTDQELYEEAAQEVRRERDELLRSSDWTQLLDSPEANRQLWAAYRQKLRDLPKSFGFPFKVKWPEPPK